MFYFIITEAAESFKRRIPSSTATTMNTNVLARRRGFCCHRHRIEEIQTDVAWLESRWRQFMRRRMIPERDERNWVRKLGSVMVRLLIL
jgi:hypothetical protein